MLKAYPRHSVDISWREYADIAAWLFVPRRQREGALPVFERAFKAYVGTPYAIAMPSARLGLLLLFKHFAFPTGAEVIISPFTHWSIFSVIKACRLKPVFVDIDEGTFNIDPEKARKAINKNTKALILTHMWGYPCDMDSFLSLRQEFGIKIIEDCAMACGATYKDRKVGSFGDAAIFSFGKAKAIATFGGGMLCTHDAGIDEQARRYAAGFHDEHPVSLAVNVASSMAANILTRPALFFLSIYPVMRFFNIKDPYNPMEHGKDAAVFPDTLPDAWKIRMSGLQAVVGMRQLKDLDSRNSQRMRHAQVLNEILRHAPGIAVPLSSADAGHIYLYYALLVNKRASLDDIRKRLICCGVDSQLNELTTARELAVFGADSRDYPVFHRVSTRLLIIPNGVYLNTQDIQYVGRTLKKILEVMD